MQFPGRLVTVPGTYGRTLPGLPACINPRNTLGISTETAELSTKIDRAYVTCGCNSQTRNSLRYGRHLTLPASVSIRVLSAGAGMATTSSHHRCRRHSILVVLAIRYLLDDSDSIVGLCGSLTSTYFQALLTLEQLGFRPEGRL